MGTFSESSIEGNVYIQQLATYIRRNEEALANGLLSFSKSRSNVKSLRINFTIHHLYFIIDRLDSSSLGVDIGPLNVKLDTPNHEPTFISFLANNARSRHFDSDTRSISSINSMKSIVSSASVYIRSFNSSKDPNTFQKDLKYIYSSFTKIPCLVLTPKTKTASILSYEEYPCDTAVPLKMFKNLQVLELISYEPNEIVGWHHLADQLRILIIRNARISDLGELLFNLVIDDESGRSSFNIHRRKHDFLENALSYDILDHENAFLRRDFDDNWRKTRHKDIDDVFRRDAFEESKHSKDDNDTPKPFDGYQKRSRSNTVGAGSDTVYEVKDYKRLPESKWSFLKQLTVTETSISSISNYIFKPLGNLVKLNLSANLLEEIPSGIDKLHNVKYLNFADNYIKDLSNLPKNLHHLTTLNLNNNKLTNLNGLQNLITLEKIDLRRNQLAEISDLKPLILLVIKCEKFNNVYIANNKLPKSYRTDLFNLFNGVKYNNTARIDDSRPGYFELSSLLDSDSAFKNLEKFFIHLSKRLSTLTVEKTDTTVDKQLKCLSIQEEAKLGQSSTKVEVVHTNKSTRKEVPKSPASPLSNNQNAANKLELPEHLPRSKNTANPPATNLKKSTTFNTNLDTHTAPNIVTQVLVTARMST